jgi:hypothetical protein
MNDLLFRVRQNLYNFLQVFRERTDPCLIWIDQLGIDQDCLEERSHQVGLMEDSYRGAEHTLIWLGVDPTHGHASAAMHRIAAVPKDYKVTRYMDAADEKALAIMLQEPYWLRHWIVQEVVLSKGRTVLYGQSEFTWAQIDASV